MNPLNYATLEPSQRLVKAGIVLETDFYFKDFDGEITLVSRKERDSWIVQAKVGHASPTAIFIPNPSMAEVWRELPESKELASLIEKVMDEHCGEMWENPDVLDMLRDPDKIIDLLIWVKQENEAKG